MKSLTESFSRGTSHLSVEEALEGNTRGSLDSSGSLHISYSAFLCALGSAGDNIDFSPLKDANHVSSPCPSFRSAAEFVSNFGTPPSSNELSPSLLFVALRAASSRTSPSVAALCPEDEGERRLLGGTAGGRWCTSFDLLDVNGFGNMSTPSLEIPASSVVRCSASRVESFSIVLSSS